MKCPSPRRQRIFHKAKLTLIPSETLPSAWPSGDWNGRLSSIRRPDPNCSKKSPEYDIIRRMNLRSIDLNLLVVLDALLDEAHVSRAASRLNLSQPAVSNALQRCRDLFDDPLLERGRGVMTRTSRAEALRRPLKEILHGVVGLVEPPEIPLAEIARTVRIIAADDPTPMITGGLMPALRKSAPGIRVVFLPWRGAGSAARDLADGDADLAVAVFGKDHEDLEIRAILRETYAVAMRRDHPATKAFDLEAWLAWPHVVVSGMGDPRTPLDGALRKIGRTRTIGLVVPAFHLVPDVLVSSDLIAMMPRHSIARHHRADIASFDPPIPVAGFPLHLAWHRRNDSEKAVRHVADLIEDIFAELVDERLNIHQADLRIDDPSIGPIPVGAATDGHPHRRTELTDDKDPDPCLPP